MADTQAVPLKPNSKNLLGNKIPLQKWLQCLKNTESTPILSSLGFLRVYGLQRKKKDTILYDATDSDC